MFKELIKRERRALTRLFLIAIPGALGFLALSTAADWTYTTALTTDGSRPGPWFVGWFLVLIITQHVFGRAWANGGQRFLHRIPASKPKLFGVKILMSLLATMLVLAILVAGNEIIIEFLSPKLMGKWGERFSTPDLIWTSILVYGLGVFAGTAIPSGAGAVAIAFLISICYPFVVILTFDHWLSFHDIDEDLVAQIGFAAAPIVGLIFLSVAFIVFLFARLQRRTMFRISAVTLLAACACLLPATGVAAWLVDRHETVTAHDKDMRIAAWRLIPENNQLRVNLYRKGYPNPHLLILDASTGEDLFFQDKALERGFDPVQSQLVIKDMSNLPMGRTYEESDFDGKELLLSKDGRSAEELPSIYPVEYMAGWRFAVLRQANLITHLDGSRRLVMVRHGETGHIVFNRELPSKNPLIRRWQDNWVVRSTWRKKSALPDYGVEIWPMWKKGREKVIIKDLAPAYIGSANTLHFGDGGKVRYIHKDRLHILELDLETRTTTTVYQAPKSQFPIDKITVSPQGRYVLCRYGPARDETEVDGPYKRGYRESWGILDTQSGSFKPWDPRLWQPWVWPWALEDERYLVVHNRQEREEGVAIFDLETQEELRRFDFNQVLNLLQNYDKKKNLIYFADKKSILTFNLKTKEVKTLWRVDGESTR